MKELTALMNTLPCYMPVQYNDEIESVNDIHDNSYNADDLQELSEILNVPVSEVVRILTTK